MFSDFLGGCRILLAEDNAPLSRFLEQVLHDAGADVVGPAATLDEAGKLARETEGLAAALLDVRLYDGEEVWPVARLLASKNVPFVFYSSHLEIIPTDWCDRPFLSKPSTVRNIIGALSDAAAVHQKGAGDLGKS